MSNNIPSCAVVVSSVDHFSDIWPQFFHFFYKYWPKPNFPVYLVANYRSFDDSRVKSILLGEDQHWGTNLLNTLKQVDAEYIIYIQDDYLLRKPVSNDFFESTLQWMKNHEAKFLNIFAHDKGSQERPDQPFDGVNLNYQWSVSLQAAIWEVKTLEEQVEAGWTPWDAESKLNQFAKSENGEGFYTIKPDQADEFNYIQGVKGGFWVKDALEYCKSQNVPVNTQRRPCPPWGESFFKKSYRSFLKRKMKLIQKIESKCCKNKKVSSLYIN